MIFTIGHGSRSIEEFIGTLRQANIARLVDVRAFPGSRRHPRFGREALEKSVAENGMQYLWEGKALGGRRKPKPGSPHVALRNESFRAYADHMQSEEFATAVQRLVTLSADANVAIMCAERLPWQCHRFLIADFLTGHGNPVNHLINEGKMQEHRLNSIAKVHADELIYNGEAQLELEAPEK
ncbi:MAG: DUF488 family protein [Burkholderiales bacterium]